MLDVSHVSLSYGDRLILRDVDVQIQKVKRRCHIQGQVVGFLGPSGCGKTSLFRIMAGLSQPTSGGVFINSTHESVKAGMVGVVPQDYALFEHRTVMGNLMLAASKKYSGDKERRERVDEYVAMFELRNQVHHYPAQLSGGQRQRVSIVQQLLSSSHFILMDEPFSGLDILMVDKVCKLIEGISCLDELNTAVIVSHDVASVCSVADHLWLLGRDKAPDGNGWLPGARIQENLNLIDLGLCWQHEIQTRPDFVDFVRTVKERFRTL